VNDPELLQKAYDTIFANIEQKEREELQRSVDALAPILGEEDAKIAVQLDHDIRTAPRRAMAEAGAELIRSKINQPGMLSRILIVSPLPAKEPT
jgi:hypothetical protein